MSNSIGRRFTGKMLLLGGAMGVLRHYSIQKLVLTLVTLCTVFGIGIVALVAAYEIQISTQEKFEERLTLAHVEAGYLDDLLRHAIDHLSMTANDIIIDGQTVHMGSRTAELSGVITEAVGLHVSNVVVLSLDRRILFADPSLSATRSAGLKAGFDPMAAISTNPVSRVSGLLLGDGSADPFVVLSVPIKDSAGRIDGVLAVLVDVADESFARVVRGVNVGSTGYSQIVDNRGMVVANSLAERAYKLSNHASVLVPLVKAHQATVASYHVVENGGAESEIIAFAPLSNASWGVTVEQSEDEAMAPIREFGITLTIFAAVALVLSLALFWLVTDRLMAPIRALTAVSRRITAGDASARAAERGYAESIELARAFNSMRDRLQASLEEIEHWNIELEERVRERTARLLSLAEDLTNTNQELQTTYLSSLEALTLAIETRDAYTLSHSREVARYAMQIGRELGLSDGELESLRPAALLHDLGKIGIPDAILRKDGSLTVAEWGLIRQHPELSCDVLAGLKFMADALAPIRHHHESYDGRGYPDKLVGESIPLGARIIAVADSLHAMTSTRPYRRARSLDEAKAELIRCKGSQFDPLVVDALVRLLDRELASATSGGDDALAVKG